MAAQAQRTDLTFWTTAQPAEELEPLEVGVDHHCLFLSGVVCEVQPELILCVALEMESVENDNGHMIM